MLDQMHESRKGYVIELALMKPKWGLSKLAKETNKVYGEGPTRISHKGVKVILDEAGIQKVNGKWQRT